MKREFTMLVGGAAGYQIAARVQQRAKPVIGISAPGHQRVLHALPRHSRWARARWLHRREETAFLLRCMSL